MRSTHPESVHTRLRATALALFASRGLEEVSIREIASGAGVTSGVLYHYYPSKEDLYSAILTERVTELHARLEVANDPALEPTERLRTICAAFLDFFWDEGSGGTFLLRELLGLGAEQFRQAVEAGDARTRSYLRHALLEGMEAGAFRREDSIMCSMSLTAMLNSFARRRALGATLTVEACMHQIMGVYLAGLASTTSSEMAEAAKA